MSLSPSVGTKTGRSSNAVFSRRQSFEDRDPDVVTSELFDRASDELRADVVDLIQEAFDVCAVVPPSQLARKQRSVPPTSSKQNSPKFERGHQPTHPSFFMSNNAEKGVPFDLVPDLLESLGCPSNPDMLHEEIFVRLGIVFPPRKEEYQEHDDSPRNPGTVAPEQDGHIPFVSFEKVVALVWHFLVEDEISADNMKSAFTTFDVDGDGSLQSSEVEQVTNSLGHNSPVSAEALVDIFDRLDSDRSGVLHLHEFMSFFSTDHIKQAMAPLRATATVQSAASAKGFGSFRRTASGMNLLLAAESKKSRDREDTLLEVEPHSGDDDSTDPAHEKSSSGSDETDLRKTESPTDADSHEHVEVVGSATGEILEETKPEKHQITADPAAIVAQRGPPSATKETSGTASSSVSTDTEPSTKSGAPEVSERSRDRVDSVLSSDNEDGISHI